MKDLAFWGVYFVIAVLWTAANLWLYHRRTQPGRDLGLSGSLSIWAWDGYMVCGLAAGAVYRPFGFQLPVGWRILGLITALAGLILALWGMLEFRSLARISALKENRLITTGIYGHVRHPQHAGLLAAAFGSAVACQTWIGLLVAIVILLWSLVQTHLEDRRLIILFGDEARRYIAAVPRYVPRWATYQHDMER
ncbi:MAG TPA: isoprenylcysteine carboxylmethyltransferase family protein [Caldilineae bacterium]|jgi:protein-S-isoprenylcysteine O-methyltransferase Ste14|nr:isoprenylcysteine carboxylmethyltransferase family protein [Caldilineae bacterium]